MVNEEYLSTIQAAKLLGISRVAVFKKIQKGEIKAKKVGKNYVISKKDLGYGGKLSSAEKKALTSAVKRVVKEYGDVLKQLGRE